MRLLLAIISFLAIYMPCNAQLKKDNAIIIKDSSVDFEKVAAAFMQNGYSIQQANKTFVTTDLKSGTSAYSIKLNALILKDSIILKCYMKIDVRVMGIENQLQQVEYIGSSGSFMKKAFNDMALIAKSISNKVYFIKQ